MQTPNRQVTYEGTAKIDGVAGQYAPILQNYYETAGAQCGALLPTGNEIDVIDDIDCTLIDNGMPSVLLRAADLHRADRNKLRMLTYSGSGLWEHSAALHSALINDHWDAVVMHDYSNGPITEWDRFVSASDALGGIARAQGTAPMLMMTWAYAGQPEMTLELAEAYTIMFVIQHGSHISGLTNSQGFHRFWNQLLYRVVGVLHCQFECILELLYPKYLHLDFQLFEHPRSSSFHRKCACPGTSAIEPILELKKSLVACNERSHRATK